MATTKSLISHKCKDQSQSEVDDKSTVAIDFAFL